MKVLCCGGGGLTMPNKGIRHIASLARGGCARLLDIVEAEASVRGLRGCRSALQGVCVDVNDEGLHET